MGDALKKVAAGEPLRIPAQAYNAFVDAAVDLRRRQQAPARDPMRLLRQTGIVLIRNDSGEDVARFGILGVDGPLIDPKANEGEFAARIALSGVAPSLPDHRGRFVITLEPIAEGALGIACIGGVCQAKVLVGEGEDAPTAADAEPGETAYLVPRVDGSAAVLWVEPGEGEQWAVVRLGNPFPAAPFPVTLTQVGGAQGTASAAATWTYDVADAISGGSLATAANPTASPHQWRRPGVGAISPATFGYAHYTAQGELAVGWINETLEQEACSGGGDGSDGG